MNANLNFNNTGGQPFCEAAATTEEVRNNLLSQLPSILHYLLPNGKFYKNQFHVGNIHGDKGESLKVELSGLKAGLWQDFATGESGDIFDLWANVRGLDAKSKFPKLIEDIKDWLGVYTPFRTSFKSKASTNKNVTNDNFGKPSAEWIYTDINGKMIAKKLRYDFEDEKKYLPWDEERKAYKMPKIRPLYNLPGIVESKNVILVEGEKCAQSLIDKGLCATTAMGGAKAPLDKTDWSPLKGKEIIIWPDNDTTGREYAEKVANFLKTKSVRYVSILNIPEGKIDKWDAADAIEERMDAKLFIESATKKVVYCRKRTTFLKTGTCRKDKSPIAEDLVSPRIITPGCLSVFGGAPKVGKSDFLLNWMAHMAGGIPFLEMTPLRPLKICFLQTEVEYDYLRERIDTISLDQEQWKLVDNNLSITPKVDITLNEEGVEGLIEDIKDHFQDELVDIIVIDPLYDVFDSNGNDLGENDNGLMKIFLKDRVEYLRDQINPKAGIIIAHHTKKISKSLFEEDPFNALAGASCIRRRFTSGLILYCPDETQTARKMIIEIRNGPKVPTKWVDKINNKWQILNSACMKIANQKTCNKQDVERNRKRDAILEIIDNQALLGSIFTMQQFCEKFEGKEGLGSNKSIRERVEILATEGEIKFCKNAEIYGFPSPERSKYGYLCIDNMYLKSGRDTILVYPTHYKCPRSGNIIEIKKTKNMELFL